jgi:hypothetical protein
MNPSQWKYEKYQRDENNKESARYRGLYTENPRVGGSIPPLATIYSVTYCARQFFCPPSSQSVHHRYASDLLTPVFASNLESLMDGDLAAIWVHDHMHDPFDYEIYGTRVVCNPRGYAPRALAPDFRPDLVVDI